MVQGSVAVGGKATGGEVGVVGTPASPLEQRSGRKRTRRRLVVVRGHPGSSMVVELYFNGFYDQFSLKRNLIWYYF